MTAITGSDIDLFRMSVLEKALKLELLGMKGRGRSAYSVIKSEYGLKGNKQSVYDQFVAYRNAKIEGEFGYSPLPGARFAHGGQNE
tara:strand:- start:37 stop:294 length:258 start_codon:yes stop_codon:yes gene_type:complete